jgi:predicted nucleotidyltransferase
MELERATHAVCEALRNEPAISAAWIFGSVARGTAGSGSDVDVAVLRGSPTPKTFDDPVFELGDRIARVLGRDVQVVELEGAPADLVHRVLRDGILVLDRDRSRRIAFEVAARNRYFDMAPIWRRYRGAEAPR